ncbi:MAG TPA: hypothetical protein VIW73_08880 [Candidatus Cybelea sp.]
MTPIATVLVDLRAEALGLEAAIGKKTTAPADAARYKILLDRVRAKIDRLEGR